MIKFKEIKIIAIILAIIGFWFKAKKSGKNEQELKQFKEDEKIKQKINKVKHIYSNDKLIDGVQDGSLF